MADSREPSCLRCAALEREVKRLRVQNRNDLDALNDAQSDVRALRRAVYRLSQLLAAEDDR